VILLNGTKITGSLTVTQNINASGIFTLYNTAATFSIYPINKYLLYQDPSDPFGNSFYVYLTGSGIVDNKQVLLGTGNKGLSINDKIKVLSTETQITGSLVVTGSISNNTTVTTTALITPQTVTEDITIPNNFNGMLIGPVGLNSNVTDINPYDGGDDLRIYYPGGGSGNITMDPSGSISIGTPTGSIGIDPTGSIKIGPPSGSIIVGPSGSIKIGGPSGSINIPPTGSITISGSVVISGSLIVSGSTTVICDCGCQSSICTGSVSASVNITNEVFKIVSGSDVYSLYTKTNSIFVGKAAGDSVPNLSQSVFIGDNAGNQAYFATSSTFVGASAGFFAYSASNATFIGPGAGGFANDSFKSVFIGYTAGNNASGSSGSVFIGDTAGASAPESDNSVLIGYYSGYGSSNGKTNVSIGYIAGQAAPNCSENVSIGGNAGGSAYSTLRNVFIGSGAGGNAFRSTGSIFIGAGAGGNCESGSYNIAIGDKTGYNQLGASISSYNILLGNNITVPNGSSNRLNIGGLIFGTSVYSPFNRGSVPFSGSADGFVGINQPEPNFALDVVGTIYASGSLRASNVLALAPQNPLPSAVEYAFSFAVSSSGVPFFSNGSTWTPLF